MKLRKKSKKPLQRYMMDVNGVEVEVVRKDIKNLRMVVYPPDGQVRVSVPLRVNDDSMRAACLKAF